MTSAAGAAAPAAATPTDAAASPALLAAMERDLGLTPTEAQARIASDAAFSATMHALEADLTGSYAGAWISGDELIVAITDPASAEQVRAASGEPTLVAHSQDTLDGVVATLNGLPPLTADEVVSWYVDVTTNQVVVEASPEALDRAAGWIQTGGVDAELVRIETTTEQPVPLFDVVGGDAYFPGNSRCSVGFAVTGGFVTAGHCGGVGTTTSGFNGAAQGTVQGSSFPGNDMGWVAVNANWSTTPLVNQYNGSAVTVTGSSQAGVGSAICRSGSTTGWHCGTVEVLNTSVTYPQGTVTGVTRTNVCAEPGDSGGSYIAGSQAQGVTSGGSGNCSSGGTTFFQPVNPILSNYGLTLVTG